LYAYYKINGFNFGVDPWKPTEPGKPVSDYVFPIFIVTKIPTVLKGFMIAAILAAAMSSVSAALSAMGSMITMDIYRPLRGALADAKAEMTLSRIMTGVSALALGLVAWAASFGSEVISLAFTLAGLTGGGILGVFVYGMIHKKGHEVPVIAGLLVSLAFMTALNLGMNPSLLPGVEAEALISKIQWPWHPMIGMIVCMATIYALRPFFTVPAGRNMGDAEEEE
jgi:Na+/proline symporter